MNASVVWKSANFLRSLKQYKNGRYVSIGGNLSVVHVLNLKTIMHSIVISFSINYTTTRIVFVITLLCQIKGYSKIQISHFFCQKVRLLKQIINIVLSITKSDPLI